MAYNLDNSGDADIDRLIRACYPAYSVISGNNSIRGLHDYSGRRSFRSYPPNVQRHAPDDAAGDARDDPRHRDKDDAHDNRDDHDHRCHWLYDHRHDVDNVDQLDHEHHDHDYDDLVRQRQSRRPIRRESERGAVTFDQYASAARYLRRWKNVAVFAVS
jgi:hypothetical protein